MSTAVMMERTGMGVPGMAMPGVTTPTVTTPTSPVGANWLMVPRCTVKFEKCQGGMKVVCTSDDKVSCSMVQNLCTMLAGGACSCYVMMNGMTVCCCNFTMGMCRCEMTEHGVVMTCTSGDPHCCEMIQACCECLCTMMEAGCTCFVCMNNTPVCCGCKECVTTTGKKK